MCLSFDKNRTFNTPILFLIFNRPDLTKIVFKRIREIQPKYLYIAADGPRVTHPDDIDKCSHARKVVMDLIDWDCKVKTLFREQNLGCGKAVGNAISWFFEQVKEGIILEDDCLPDLTFFDFCKTLLDYYRYNYEIYHVSGSNFQNGKKRGQGSYYFSKYPHCWGWATWSRAWVKFDFLLKDVETNTIRDALVRYQSLNEEIDYWLNIYNQFSKNLFDSWSYPWTFKIWSENGKVILPNKNLTLNLGFREDATHTSKNKTSYKSKLKSIEFPLLHVKPVINKNADHYTFKKHFYPKSILKNKMKVILRPIKYTLKFIAFCLVYKRFKKYTMIPKKIYISNLMLAYNIKNVSGTIVECGTWKGGMIAGLTYIFGKHRAYHLFDSFQGLPKASSIDGEEAKKWQSNQYGEYYFNNCKAALDDAQTAMKRSMANKYELHKGWFNETLPEFYPENGIALLRLDADWYESTLACLKHLFAKVNNNGIVIIDDYFMWEGCSKAVHNYLAKIDSPCKINVFQGVCYIIKK